MSSKPLSLLFSVASQRQIATIVALAVLGALTEGIGFVLLVPLLAILLDGTGQSALFSPITQWMSASGWAPSLGVLLAGFAALVILRAIADYVRVMVSTRMSISLVDRLRERAFRALLAADWRALSRMRQSENRSVLISEIDRTALAIDTLGGLVRTTIGLAAIALAALAISPAAALAGGAIGSAAFILYAGLRRRARSLGEALGTQYRQVHGLLEENLNALRVIKSFSAEDQTTGRVLDGFKGLREVRLRFAADTVRARAFLQSGAAILTAGGVWLALERWDAPLIVILPLVALFARALPQMSGLLDSWQVWSHAAPAVESAHALIHEAEQAAERNPGVAAEPPTLTDAISLQNITLSHREGVATLQDVSLTLQADETVALVGPSGAGKSTLADILGGLIAPDSGQVAIDGTPLDPAARYGWRRSVAYVDQSPVLFHGTIRENLRWADPEADDNRLHQVLKMASAGFVLDLPDALDCPIGESGHQLSGGERQRIVLARALLRDPALLILDEATSALDPASDTAVAESIAAMNGQRAILIIGHRGALTQSARRIVTLEEGRVVSDAAR